MPTTVVKSGKDSTLTRLKRPRDLLVAVFVGALTLANLWFGLFSPTDSLLLVSIGGILTFYTLLTSSTFREMICRSDFIILYMFYGIVITVCAIQMALPGFDHEENLLALLRLIGIGTFFLSGASIGNSVRDTRAFMRAWPVGSLIFGLTTLLLFILSFNLIIPSRIFNLDSRRLNYPMLSPNSTALALLIVGITTGAIWISRLGRMKKIVNQRPSYDSTLWVSGGALGILAFALCLTRSRSGIALAVLLIFAFIPVIYSRHWKRLLWLSLPLFASALGIIILLTFSRLQHTNDDLVFRLKIYKAHGKFAFDSPGLGHGFGGFAEANRQLIELNNFTALYNIGAAHNLYIQWLEQAGVWATLSMGATVTWAAALIMPRLKFESSTERYFSISVILCVLGAALQGILDLGLEHYSIACTLAAVMGVAVGNALRLRKTDDSRSDEALAKSPKRKELSGT